ncbi:2-succinyl-5-enolpyruvyl-6-hydroxy-3-cyclohexene-1-carboxylate synthase [Sinobacterium norvegicum]|uniref:2-succinyl-5-enolpyruvyl-6-hydroxy-3-cyclohexene-1-carboxylate synthase n=1 Tax=Sinobacterium norvegicum TaxID=1641715 RepID=A0ABM9AER9_9GAMM|nr:2-succinyl-5-enolpyruvyl-6-hydroxy-3-cyclohexene-1-carboxylic-acid synthase [Sinobacterium norvegicum]CAH0991690.1 2-succinyl-5-enolpyruvyl-6-hydroxy-3-cyclohexene-1-carboxylate synthase [Sinobacterium norvegicum]
MSQLTVNRSWALLVLTELQRLGVEHVCIAPGSRSTLLTEQAQQLNCSLHTHFDERGLCFYALGLSKASQSPVALIVTSGTAVANLLPAVVEAGLTGERLVLITADRPESLIDCGANQAIQQQGIFSTHVVATLNLPAASTDIPASWLLSSVDQLVYKQRLMPGPVHINMPFREPLYGGEQTLDHDYMHTVDGWTKSDGCYLQRLINTDIYALPESDFSDQRGVIIVGQITMQDRENIILLSERLGWPVLADSQSGIVNQFGGYDLWLDNPKANELLSRATVLLQFGGRVISKRLLAFVAAQSWQQYWLVAESEQRLDSSHRQLVQIKANIAQWASAYSCRLAAQSSASWADDLAVMLLVIRCHVAEFLASEKLNEATIVSSLNNLSVEQTNVFIGNSLMARMLDIFSSFHSGHIYSNRGASGIDGLVATFAGCAVPSEQPMLLVIGDTALLHDLNSMALLQQKNRPLIVLVVNNNGGAIFDFLPVNEANKKQYYQMPHGLNFYHAASMFGLCYRQVDEKNSFEEAVTSALGRNQTTVIEAVVPEHGAVVMMQRLRQKIADLVGSDDD